MVPMNFNASRFTTNRPTRAFAELWAVVVSNALPQFLHLVKPGERNYEPLFTHSPAMTTSPYQWPTLSTRQSRRVSTLRPDSFAFTGKFSSPPEQVSTCCRRISFDGNVLGVEQRGQQIPAARCQSVLARASPESVWPYLHS